MDNMTQETLEEFKKALSTPSEEFRKSISTATGLLAYDLQQPAKNLYPFLTPLRNVIPRVGGGTGSATNWRQVSAITGSGFDSMGWVPEGQRSGRMSYTTANKLASYVTIAEEDSITMEAINAARNFEDLQASMARRLLQKMMLKEEMAILAGNQSLALGTPATPTVSAATNANSTLPTGTYKVKVVGLTLEGYRNSSLTAGVATSSTITGADGRNYTLSGGSSALSAESAGQATVISTSGLGMTTTAMQGAAAYAWYVSSASGTGDETLQMITTINQAVLSVPLVASRQASTSITADNSLNANYAYDGLLTTALKAGSGAYVNILPTGTVGTGTTLTSSGRGGVVEIDTMFQTMWDNFEVSPTVIYVNSQELKNITNKALNGSSAPLLRINQSGDGGPYRMTASGVVGWYYNPFTATDAGVEVPIRIHPKLSPGTIIGWADNLPAQYQSNEVPNAVEMKLRQEYYQIDWPVITRARDVGVYCEEVLAVYAPFAMGVISNIANG